MGPAAIFAGSCWSQEEVPENSDKEVPKSVAWTLTCDRQPQQTSVNLIVCSTIEIYFN